MCGDLRQIHGQEIVHHEDHEENKEIMKVL